MMIKKSFATLTVVVLAATSGITYAADNTVTRISSGVYVENTAAGCSLLRDRVTVNTSTGVTMVYNCVTAASKVNLGACHASGSQKPTTVRCQNVSEEEGEVVYNNTSCQGTDEDDTFQINGRRAYVASTTGGSVAQVSLEATECSEDSLGALATVAN
ncbi:hypothetical protein NA647_14530 [Pseudomonas stutzeri]|uniref:hypothetical protein n=1 Tax=Stutzerimonas stutzeri TaxID=316 RepID=UPI0021087E7F|nr:hypothetical protein [Stutzerimonas stutzeri]MCQ4288645.1 hypothetical protein [Stutzerimonas stutzeri]